MGNMMGKTLKLREDLTLVGIEDKAALLDVENRRYFDPNDTASFLLKLIDEGCLFENLVATLVSHFSVAEDTARADVDHFVEELLKLDLVKVGEARAHDIVPKLGNEKEFYRAPQLESQALAAVVAGGIGNVVSPK